MTSPRTGLDPNSPSSIFPGTTTNAPVTFPSRITSKTSFSNGATPSHQNLNTLPFATHPSSTAPNSNSLTLLTPAPPLDATGVKRIQDIIGALLYYGNAVDNKLLVALGDLASTQAAATELTKTDLGQLLDYLSTYPDDGILYRSSAMILSAHSDAAYLNVPRARSLACAHIMLSENTPVPSLNGPVLTIAQIIKNVMSSAAEAELSGLFV